MNSAKSTKKTADKTTPSKHKAGLLGFILSCVVVIGGLIAFAVINWDGTGCDDIRGISYNDLQHCVKITKQYPSYHSLLDEQKNPSSQRISIRSVGKDCRVYITIFSPQKSDQIDWTDYCLITKPSKFKACVAKAPVPEQAKCQHLLDR
jgi:hypothetical protein